MKLKHIYQPPDPQPKLGDPDFPIIWDIIKRKLDAGEKIVMPLTTNQKHIYDEPEYEDVQVIGLHYDEKDTTLPYAIVWKRGTPSNNLLWFDGEMIQDWRFHKDGDHWKLTT